MSRDTRAGNERTATRSGWRFRFPARLFALALALAFGTPAPAPAETSQQSERTLPHYSPADAAAAEVREPNLLASERFWPEQTELTRPWRPPGREQALEPGLSGVLIRVEADGTARVDFGRDGLFRVPVSSTDLVARANRVRRGELDKTQPNLVLAIGNRLLDPSGESLARFPYERAAERRLFLCVFADPASAQLEPLAHALAPLRARDDLLTVFFPLARLADAAVSERLRALGWPVPFVYDHLAEPYARTLSDESGAPPAVLLATAEGRVLLARGAGADLAAEIERALSSSEP